MSAKYDRGLAGATAVHTGSISRFNLQSLLTAAPQAFSQEALVVSSARMAGDVNQPLHLLHSPIARTDARCRVPKMTEGFLDQRDLRIVAAAVEQAPQSDHPDLRREFRFLGSKIPCGAHEGRGLSRKVSRAG